jgi:hypothetical protein
MNFIKLTYDYYLLAFFAIFIIISSQDENIQKCKTYIGKSVIILHHLFSCVLILPFLHRQYLLTLFFIFITAISWILLNDCLITTIQDICCQLKVGYFKDINHYIFNIFNKKLSKDETFYVLAIEGIIISSYCIYKLYYSK